MLCTPEGKWVLWNEDGHQIARWPVDAKAMIGHGFSATPPTGVEPDVPPAPPAAAAPPQPLPVGASRDASPGEPAKIARTKPTKG